MGAVQGAKGKVALPNWVRAKLLQLVFDPKASDAPSTNNYVPPEWAAAAISAIPYNVLTMNGSDTYSKETWAATAARILESSYDGDEDNATYSVSVKEPPAVEE